MQGNDFMISFFFTIDKKKLLIQSKLAKIEFLASSRTGIVLSIHNTGIYKGFSFLDTETDQ
jgi:hypothetical protein